MHKFHKTAFHVAVKSGVAIQPVAIYCRPLFLGKGQSWISFCRANNRMVVRYLPPVQINDLAEEQRNASGLSEVVKERIEQALESMDKMSTNKS
jgi:1-acyl-sn-glycerol-3-phosphate acyltransferase